jgi:AbrB family looped-hinge helix DNA binding protein
MTAMVVETAKVMAKGQVTLPVDVRRLLGVAPGDRVLFVVDESGVRLGNTAMLPLSALQQSLRGAAEEAGWDSEEDVAAYITQSRRAKTSK